MSTTQGLNHCWLRIVNDKGKIISAGMCGDINKIAMSRGLVGRINSPDHREFSSEPKRQTRILIKKEEYKVLKNKIENDQKTHNFYFNLLTRNCSTYVCEVIQTIGLEVNNKEFLSQLVLRAFFKRIKINPPETILKVLSPIFYISQMTLGTISSFLMGAWYQNADVKILEKDYSSQWLEKPKKPFRSWKSFVNGNNSKMPSSFKVADWQEYVERHRSTRLKHLKNEKELFDHDIVKSEKFRRRIGKILKGKWL